MPLRGDAQFNGASCAVRGKKTMEASAAPTPALDGHVGWTMKTPAQRYEEQRLATERASAAAERQLAAAAAAQETRRLAELRKTVAPFGVWQCKCSMFVGRVTWIHDSSSGQAYCKGRGMGLLTKASDKGCTALFALHGARLEAASRLCWRCGAAQPWRCNTCGLGMYSEPAKEVCARHASVDDYAEG